MNFSSNFSAFITKVLSEPEREYNSVLFKLLWRNIINPIYMGKVYELFCIDKTYTVTGSFL